MQTNLILTNGKIYTQDNAQPFVSAIAIYGNRIIAAGSDEDINNLANAETTLIDLEGRLVLPGLTDAHVHLSWYAHFLHNVDLTTATSAQHAAEIAAEKAKTLPSGEWVRGRGWSQDRWEGRAFPTAAQLDALIPDHPVYLSAHSGHAVWLNSMAMRMAGIDAETPDPPGGQIQRNENGQPTGILFETALDLINRVAPEPTAEKLAEQIKGAIKKAHGYGLTGLHDFDGATAFRAYQMLHQSKELNLRIVKNIPVELLDEAAALGLRWGFGNDMLRIGGVKTFADGALGPRTAWMIDPYEGEPDNIGIAVTDPEEMMANVSKASKLGLPSTIHAIGDRAVHQVLNVYEAVRKEEAARGVSPEQMRHRVEHVQLIAPTDVGRLGAMEVIASMQPNHAPSDMDKADSNWGDRADFAYNFRVQLDSGAILALGSDSPIEPIAPLPNIQTAVTRRRLDGSPGVDGWRSGLDGRNRLTIEEAIAGFTTGAAYAAGMEDRLGRIKTGYLADLVVLDGDIFTCDPMQIGEAGIAGTMIGGEWVYRGF